MKCRWALAVLSLGPGLPACRESCRLPDAATDGTYVTALAQPEPSDIVTVVVDGDLVTITWTLEDGSTRDVAYTVGEISHDRPQGSAQDDTGAEDEG